MNVDSVVNGIFRKTGIMFMPRILISRGRGVGELIKTLRLEGGWQGRCLVEMVMRGDRTLSSFEPSDSFFIGTPQLLVKKDYEDIGSIADAAEEFKLQNPYFVWD